MKKQNTYIALRPGYNEAEYREYQGEEKPQEAGLEEYLEAFATIMMTIFIGFLKVLLFFINVYVQYQEEKERTHDQRPDP
jgi:heme/copper-type cytochrome/quinol oxidase subunit 2